MGPKCFGPFKIIGRVGTVAYHLELPPAATIHPVFHVSQLEKALRDTEFSQPLPTHLDTTLEWVVEPDQVLGVRKVGSKQQPKMEVLIQLKGLPKDEASWESASSIQQQFPNFHLEDKVILETRGIVAPNPFHLC